MQRRKHEKSPQVSLRLRRLGPTLTLTITRTRNLYPYPNQSLGLGGSVGRGLGP